MWFQESAVLSLFSDTFFNILSLHVVLNYFSSSCQLFLIFLFSLSLDWFLLSITR